MTSCPLRASPIAVPSPNPEPAPVTRIFLRIASSLMQRSGAEPIRLAARLRRPSQPRSLVRPGPRDADRSEQIAVDCPQRNSAREGYKSAIRVFETVRLGVRLAYVPYRVRFRLEQDRSPGLSERDIGGSEPSSVHSRKGLHVARRIEDRNAHCDPDRLCFRSGGADQFVGLLGSELHDPLRSADMSTGRGVTALEKAGQAPKGFRTGAVTLA